MSIEKMGSFRPWVKKIMPTVYDDSLTYYELVSKVIAYLNQAIAQSNEIIDVVDYNKTDASGQMQGLRTDFERVTLEQNQTIASNNQGVLSQLNALKIQFETVKLWLENEAMPQNIESKLDSWFDSGKLAQIINTTVFDMKANKTDVDIENAKNVKKGDLVYNVKDFGAVGDANFIKLNNGAGNDWYSDQSFTKLATDDTVAIENAIAEALKTGGIVFFPQGGYRTTRPLKIVSGGITFMSSQSKNFPKSGRIVYDGVVGGNVIEIGNLIDENTSSLVSPVNFVNMSFSSSEKAAYIIYSNGTNFSNIENCEFRTSLGAIYAPHSWYMSINNCRFLGEYNYTSVLPKILDYISQDIWDKISKGYIYLSAFNSGSFKHNNINNLYVIRNGVKGHPRIITIDGGNAFTIDDLCIESLYFSNSIINFGYDGVTKYGQYTGSIHVDGLYLENVSSTATGLEAIFQMGKNQYANIEISNVFCYNVHSYMWIKHSTNYNSHSKTVFKNVHFTDYCSFLNLFMGVNGHKVEFVDCFMITGVKKETETDVIFEPFVGDVDGYGRKTWDTKLGVNADPLIIDGRSYVHSGLTTITSGSDSSGLYIDVLMDGEIALLNGKHVLASYKRNGINVKVRLRPTYSGVSETIYYLYMTQAGTLILKTATIPSTYAIYLAKITISTSGVVTVDTTVRKPPHIVVNAKGAINVIASLSAQPTTGLWSWGDIVYNSQPLTGGNIGWICIGAGTGTQAVWKSLGTIS
jgi:hypothetical protein